MKQKSLVKNSIFNIIYTLANLLFPFVTSIYVARILTTTAIGKIAYAQNIVSYFVVIAALGLPSYGVRELAKVRDDYEKKCTLFTELMVINFISSLICTIVYVILILNNTNMHHDLTLYIVCGLSLLFNFINIDWLYQGEEEYGYITKRSIFIKLLSFIALFIFVKTRDHYIRYALISSVATGGNYIWNVINAHNYVHFSFKNFNIIKHLKPVFVLAIIIFLSQIYSKIDTTMIGTMCAKDKVAYYSYSQKIINMVLTLCTAITAALFPRMSYYYTNDRKQFYVLLNKAYRILCLLTFPIAIGLFIVAKDVVVLLYGSSYMESVLTIRIFCIMILIRPFGDLFCYQLVYAIRKEKIVIPASFAASVLNIIMNLLLIPAFAQNGAAIASIASELVTNLIQFLYVKKIIGYRLSARPLFIGIISSVCMALIGIISLVIINNRILKLIITIILCGLVYLFLNVIFKNKIIYEMLNLIINKVGRRKNAEESC